MRKLQVVLCSLLLLSCHTANKSGDASKDPRNPAGWGTMGKVRTAADLKDSQKRMKKGWTDDFSDSFVLQNSSTPGGLKAKQMRVLVDNDVAFLSKIDIVRKAQEKIYLTYYIWSDDESSSMLARELVRKAKNQNVKVRMMLDLMTNYKYLDLFRAMQDASGGNIQVSFYGRPTIKIMQDMFFAASRCPGNLAKTNKAACDERKQAEIERWFGSRLTAEEKEHNYSTYSAFFPSIFMSGFYSKNMDALKFALMEGGDLEVPPKDPNKTKSQEEQEKAQLMELAKLAYRAKIKGEISAKIKLGVAFLMYGDKINPLWNAVHAALPLSNFAGNKDPQRAEEWHHVSDFTHQKLIVADNKWVQLGGRNVENSYHMKPNDFSDKYIFMDTDVWAELAAGGDAMDAAFSKIFDFKDFVISLNDIETMMPNDFTAGKDELAYTNTVLAKCRKENPGRGEDFGVAMNACMEKNYNPAKRAEMKAKRMKAALAKMEANAAKYEQEYRPQGETRTWDPGNLEGTLASSDVTGGGTLLTYVENLPFDPDDKPMKRKLGAKWGHEGNTKQIHNLLVNGMKNACDDSAAQKVRKSVIIHQGYFLAPGRLLSALGNMVDGAWDCHNVDLTLITNSIGTTDLNVINILAKHQMNAFWRYKAERASNRAANVRYLEYADPFEDQAGINKKITALKASLAKSGKSQYCNKKNVCKPVDQINPTDVVRYESLHSKVNILGDDVLIGSANADIRSYFMDSNNGFFFRGAKDFVGKYGAWLRGLEQQGRIVDHTAVASTEDEVALQRFDGESLDRLMLRWDKKSRAPKGSEKYKQASEMLSGLTSGMWDVSRGIIDANYAARMYNSDMSKYADLSLGSRPEDENFYGDDLVTLIQSLIYDLDHTYEIL